MTIAFWQPCVLDPCEFSRSCTQRAGSAKRQGWNPGLKKWTCSGLWTKSKLASRCNSSHGRSAFTWKYFFLHSPQWSFGTQRIHSDSCPQQEIQWSVSRYCTDCWSLQGGGHGFGREQKGSVCSEPAPGPYHSLSIENIASSEACFAFCTHLLRNACSCAY